VLTLRRVITLVGPVAVVVAKAQARRAQAVLEATPAVAVGAAQPHAVRLTQVPAVTAVTVTFEW
jgi:hypothetical protein